MNKIEYGKECSIDIDSHTVMGIDLAKDKTDITCIVVVRKVGDKIRVIDTLQLDGNSIEDKLKEMLAKYKLKVQDENGVWNVFKE